jgi:hypothetical protein
MEEPESTSSIGLFYRTRFGQNLKDLLSARGPGRPPAKFYGVGDAHMGSGMEVDVVNCRSILL